MDRSPPGRGEEADGVNVRGGAEQRAAESRREQQQQQQQQQQRGDRDASPHTNTLIITNTLSMASRREWLLSRSSMIL